MNLSIIFNIVLAVNICVIEYAIIYGRAKKKKLKQLQKSSLPNK